MAKRVAGLDIGDKRIGVAVSDPLGVTAQPLGVVERRSLAADVAAVAEVLGGYEVDRIVAGLPYQANGSEGPQAERVRRVAAALAEATGLEVVFQDERLTTAQSERVLIESGVRRERRRRVIDKLAAALILQAYLDQRAPNEPSGV